MNSSETQPREAQPLEPRTFQSRPRSVPAPREHTTQQSTMRQSARLLAMLSRLCSDLVAAIDDGRSGADERARLHVWLRADYFPWAGGLMLSLSLAARSELARVMAEIGRLDSALACTHGANAAVIATDLEQCGAQFITGAVADVAGTN